MAGQSKPGPEWENVTVSGETATKGGDSFVKCIHCNKSFVGGATRIRAHLLSEKGFGISGCPDVPAVVVRELTEVKKRKAEEAEAKSKKAKLAAIADKAAAPLASTQSNIRQLLSKKDKEAVDAATARFFYANGIAANVARSPYFHKFIDAVATYGKGYKPPKADALLTTLLEKEKARIQKDLQPIMDTMETQGCTLTSDGWSNTQHRPLLNFLIVTTKGNIFLGAHDTSGEVKSADYIAQELLDKIREVGPDNVIQIVTDSAASCKAAGRLVEEQFPHITWTPCTAHCLDLLLEDIGKTAWAKDIIREGKDIVQFISNHHKSLAIFREHSTLQLLRPGETRFATAFIMLQRLLEVKQALEETVVARTWKEWLESQPAALNEEADNIRSTVMNNTFWKKLKELVDLCWPIVVLLREADAGGPVIGQIYWRMHEVILSITESTLPAARRNEVKDFAMKRWNMLHSIMHAAGFVLDPKYQTYDQHANEEVMEGFWKLVGKLVPEEAQGAIAEQWAKYRNNVGLFGLPAAINSIDQMSAHAWWLAFGAGAPELQSFAVKVLSQCTVASACERSWSTFDFIHSKRRNRLSAERSSDLIYVFSNPRLLDKIQIQYD